MQLYIGNLSPDWQQDAAFEKAMSTYGAIERVFIVRNARGLSKVSLLKFDKSAVELLILWASHIEDTALSQIKDNNVLTNVEEN